MLGRSGKSQDFNRRRSRGMCRGFILSLGSHLMWMAIFLNVSTAADYPSKPIQIIAAFAAGGGSDITARFLNDKVSSYLSQPVVVFNKTGGGGVIGTYAVMAAPADGYTILVASRPMISAPFLTKGVTFDFLRDFIMVNLAISYPSIIVVKKESPWLTLEALIADAKKNPGKITYSTPGYGSSAHFAGEVFKMYTGTDITHIPMDGTAPALTAVLGGHTNFAGPEMSGALKGHLQSGALRGLALLAKKRLKDFPDVPTTVEKGFPDIINAGWQGFAVRANTPQGIVAKLEKVFKESLKDTKVIEMFEKMNWVVENLGSAEAMEFLAKDQEKWAEVAKAAKIVPK